MSCPDMSAQKLNWYKWVKHTYLMWGVVYEQCSYIFTDKIKVSKKVLILQIFDSKFVTHIEQCEQFYLYDIFYQYQKQCCVAIC